MKGSYSGLENVRASVQNLALINTLIKLSLFTMANSNRQLDNTFMSPQDNKYTGLSWWLERLELEQPRENDANAEAAAQRPHTPSQIQLIHDTIEEVSPTTTTFSSESIFELPFRAHQNPTGNEADASDTTSIIGYYEHEDEDTKSEIREHSKQYTEQHLDDSYTERQSTTTLYEPSTTIAGIQEANPHPQPQTQPTAVPGPRHCLVSIVSCLQCTLQNLPCSRTPPTCSRCARKNHPPTPCLVYRARLTHEVCAGASYCTDPVLLRLPDDSDDVWCRKQRVAEELCKAWREREERRNWVLPGVDAVRGGWKRRFGEGKRRMHPGVGSGRVVMREMAV